MKKPNLFDDKIVMLIVAWFNEISHHLSHNVFTFN